MTVTVTAAVTVVVTNTVIDGATADTGTVKKQNFHTGLDPVSREDDCAQRTLSTAPTLVLNSVGCAEFFVLDTGSSPVWSVVAGTDAGDNDRAVVVTVVTVGNGVTDTVTVVSDETIVTNRKKVSSSYRQDAGIQTHGQQVRAKHSRGRRTPPTTA